MDLIVKGLAAKPDLLPSNNISRPAANDFLIVFIDQMICSDFPSIRMIPLGMPKAALPAGPDGCILFPDYKDRSAATSYRQADCRYPDYMDVMFAGLPWLLGSGTPFRNDVF